MSLPQEIRRLWESLEGRGILGQRVVRGLTAIGAGGRLNLFTITGGEILLTVLYGVCTTAETGGANNATFDATPTTGGALSPMSSATAFGAAAIGDMLCPQGGLALPAHPAAGYSGAMPTMWMPWICKVGSIGVTKSAATGNSVWRWVLCYIPLTLGAVVTPT